MSNLSWGMQFRTCKNFWTSTDFSLVDSPKILTNTKAIPPLLRLRFCESQNLTQIAESRADSADSQYLGENSKKNAESRLDSANQNNPSLRDSAKRAESWQSTNESKNSSSLAEGARGWVKNPFITRLCRFAESSIK